MPTFALVLLLTLTPLAQVPTVDPRLDEPLRLLAELPEGRDYAAMPRALWLTLAVVDLPDGVGGRYDPRSRTVMLSTMLAAEDPRVVAAALAHELKHAFDQGVIDAGVIPADCVEMEVRGFEAQAKIGRALYPDVLPSGTFAERWLAALIELYERDGVDGIRAWVVSEPGYRELCAG